MDSATIEYGCVPGSLVLPHFTWTVGLAQAPPSGHLAVTVRTNHRQIPGTVITVAAVNMVDLDVLALGSADTASVVTPEKRFINEVLRDSFSRLRNHLRVHFRKYDTHLKRPTSRLSRGAPAVGCSPLFCFFSHRVLAFCFVTGEGFLDSGYEQFDIRLHLGWVRFSE